MTVSKNRKKYDSQKALVVKHLATSFEVSTSYIRMALNGDTENLTTVEIKKEYKRLMDGINKVLK